MINIFDRLRELQDGLDEKRTVHIQIQVSESGQRRIEVTVYPRNEYRPGGSYVMTEPMMKVCDDYSDDELVDLAIEQAMEKIDTKLS